MTASPSKSNLQRASTNIIILPMKPRKNCTYLCLLLFQKGVIEFGKLITEECVSQ